MPCRDGDRAALEPDDSDARRAYEVGNTLGFVANATAAGSARLAAKKVHYQRQVALGLLDVRQVHGRQHL
jgi:hypothetical protein